MQHAPLCNPEQIVLDYLTQAASSYKLMPTLMKPAVHMGDGVLTVTLAKSKSEGANQLLQERLDNVETAFTECGFSIKHGVSQVVAPKKFIDKIILPETSHLQFYPLRLTIDMHAPDFPKALAALAEKTQLLAAGNATDHYRARTTSVDTALQVLKSNLPDQPSPQVAAETVQKLQRFTVDYAKAHHIALKSTDASYAGRGM